MTKKRLDIVLVVLALTILGLMLFSGWLGCKSWRSGSSELKQLRAEKEEYEQSQKEFKKLKEETEVFMRIRNSAKTLNYRRFATIFFIGQATYQMVVSTFFWDWVKIAILIATLTELFGFTKYLVGGWLSIVVSSIAKLSKTYTSLLFALLLIPILKLIFSADWGYFAIISPLSWGLATVGWKWLINKTGITNKVKFVNIFRGVSK